jgi:hypothetical protein
LSDRSIVHSGHCPDEQQLLRLEAADAQLGRILSFLAMDNARWPKHILIALE